MSDQPQRILFGTRKGLIIFSRSGGAGGGWKFESESHLGAQVPYAIVDSRTNTLFACLKHGHWGPKLHRSSDFGKTWTEIAAPKYPENAKLKNGQPATLKLPWVLAPGGADQPGRIYLGTEPGGLFISDDLGDTFRLCESLWNHPSRPEGWFGGGLDEPAIHSILVDPRDSRTVRIGISVAGMFTSRDDCQTWKPENKGLTAEFLPNPDVEVGHDPHLIAQSAGQPDWLWQQNHCGVFCSSDAGKNWREVSKKGNATHFGFAVAVDERQGSTAWVVPADSDEVRIAVKRSLFVSRTDDGGKTWRELRAGLPQENCYDFAFRHALDVRGDELVFGTTGGSVYVSTNRGDQWQSLGSHLPPIYSARFA